MSCHGRVTDCQRAVRRATHRDVKLENIYMTLGGSSKLGDFGCAKAHLDKELPRCDTFLGTTVRTAPHRTMAYPHVPGLHPRLARDY
jgi:serine/threonine protein kinase